MKNWHASESETDSSWIQDNINISPWQEQINWVWVFSVFASHHLYLHVFFRKFLWMQELRLDVERNVNFKHDKRYVSNQATLKYLTSFIFWLIKSMKNSALTVANFDFKISRDIILSRGGTHPSLIQCTSRITIEHLTASSNSGEL